MSDILLYNEDCNKILNNIDLSNAIIVCDPPFNINYHYNSYSDNLPENEYFSWMASIFNRCPSVVIHYPESLHKLSIYI